MTNQEAIKNAYGEYWDRCKDYVDENGWIMSNEFLFCNTKIPFEEKKVTVDYFHNRPKTLQGIEDNLGWVKIESEEDRKYRGYAWVITARENINQLQCEYFDSEIKYFYATHYKPIETPKPPIY